MLKQLKKNLFNRKISKKKFKKTLLRTKKLLNTTFSYHSKKSSILNNNFNWLKLKAIVRVTANNVFYTIIKEKKIIYVGSAGIYKLQASQKNYKICSKKYFENFL